MSHSIYIAAKFYKNLEKMEEGIVNYIDKTDDCSTVLSVFSNG